MTIREELEQNLQKELDYQKYHYMIENLIANHWEGKKLNIRFEKQLQALTGPDACIHLVLKKENFSSSTIAIWNVPEFKNYNDRFYAYLGYANDINCYSSKVFAEQDKCHGVASIERSMRIKDILENNEVEQAERTIEMVRLSIIAARAKISQHPYEIRDSIKRRIEEETKVKL